MCSPSCEGITSTKMQARPIQVQTVIPALHDGGNVSLLNQALEDELLSLNEIKLNVFKFH